MLDDNGKICTGMKCSLDHLIYWSIFSERELRYMLSPVRLSSVYLSVTLVRPTQPVEIFGMFLRHLVPWPPKILRRSSQGNPPSGELYAREAAKYNDFFDLSKAISRKCYKTGLKVS